MAQNIRQIYCQYLCEHVDAAIHASRNGTINNSCLCVVGCKKFRFCEKLSYIPVEKRKMSYVKCCGICPLVKFCKYLRNASGQDAAVIKEPAFISAKKRERMLK